MLELKNIKKSYDGVTVLKNIDLTISDGEIVSILGPSGCGKTTLLNLILGLTDADSGKIIFDGQDITNVPMEKRGFNIVFQDYALFPNLNVMQNITYGLKNTPNISTQEEVNELIELLGLKPHLNKKIDQLFRRSETESGSGKNHGDETEDPAAGRTPQRFGRCHQRIHQRKNQTDRQRLPSDNHYRYPRSRRSADTVR